MEKKMNKKKIETITDFQNEVKKDLENNYDKIIQTLLDIATNNIGIYKANDIINAAKVLKEFAFGAEEKDTNNVFYKIIETNEKKNKIIDNKIEEFLQNEFKNKKN